MKIRADILIVDTFFINKNPVKIFDFDLEIINKGHSDCYIDNTAIIRYLSDDFIRISGTLKRKIVKVKHVFEIIC